jgi:hypothetical protein
MTPLVAPVVWGANVTKKSTLWPGARVIGKLGALKLNGAPKTGTREMVISLMLLLLTEVESVLLLPT